MYQRQQGLRIPHLTGAIGSFLEAALTVISIAMSQSLTGDVVSAKVISIVEIGAMSLLLYCFMAMFSQTRDAVIKCGALIGAVGLIWQLLIGDILMAIAGLGLPSVLLIIGGLITMAGLIMINVRYIALFGKDVIITVFCIFVFFGLLLSLVLNWGGIISYGALGGILIYLYMHNISY